MSTANALPLADALRGIQAHSSSSPLIDPLGRPSTQVLDAVERAATTPWIPEEYRPAILAAVQFYRTSDNADVPLPENAPKITQFYWPTIAGKCISGETASLASAIAVPGPAALPLPGVKDDETAFVVTALGTAPLAETAGDMRVRWFNITTGQQGDTLLGNTGINPDGPATVSGIARTGSGTIVAVAYGTITTTDAPCSFAPTAAIIQHG